MEETTKPGVMSLQMTGFFVTFVLCYVKSTGNDPGTNKVCKNENKESIIT